VWESHHPQELDGADTFADAKARGQALMMADFPHLSCHDNSRETLPMLWGVYPMSDYCISNARSWVV
jgi:hypothetical protein